MPHIHTEPGQHDHTVSAYIIRYEDGVPYLLLHRHKKFNKLMQPGGHVELDETPWQAMQHEIVEETGYELSQLKLLQPPAASLTFRAPNTAVMPMPMLHNSHYVKDPTIDDHYHDDIVYAFVTDELPAQKHGEGESEEFHRVSERQLDALDKDELLVAVEQIARYVFEVCEPTWQAVDIDRFSIDSPSLS